MTNAWEQFRRDFIDSRRTLTCGYRCLLAALSGRDFKNVATLADQLDKNAGPNIEFEFQYLYPAVVSSRGEKFMRRFHNEQNGVITALCEVQVLNKESLPHERHVTQWQRSFETGLEHAAACGSMLSHLQSVPIDRQQEYLAAINRFRVAGRRWSELHRSTKRLADISAQTRTSPEEISQVNWRAQDESVIRNG